MFSAILTLGGLGVIAGLGLGIAAKKFAVEIDPKVEEVIEALPGANCGACGFPGCSGFAEAVVAGETEANGCTAGGEEVAQAIAEIMGIKVEVGEKTIAVVLCQGGREESKELFKYSGIDNCKAASIVAGGNKMCRYGCLGLGSCAAVCPFEAIYIDDNHLPVIDEDKCRSCGKCVEVCPKGIITLVPISKKVAVLCSSYDKGALVNKICQVGCIGCKKCEKVCEVQAIVVENFIARIDYDKCTNCGKCIEACPKKTIGKVNLNES